VYSKTKSTVRSLGGDEESALTQHPSAEQIRQLNYVSVGLGIISFIAIALSQITNAAVIGIGGWERLIVYHFCSGREAMAAT
jgi:hypothetical protein